MKKSYKIDVDCANCANKIEAEVNKIEGVAKATINFMALKMNVEFEEGADVKSVMKQVKSIGQKVDSDFDIEL